MRKRGNVCAWLTVSLALALALAWVPASRACDVGAEPVIAEFMASNTSTLADEDGDFSDWIEIYNPCQPGVSLDGWYLTDDSSQLTKWRFPAVTLDRGGFLLVFASGKNRAVAGSPLHTSFKLAAEGEYLALVKPDGTTIVHQFSPQYPPQYPDVSYGLPQAAAKRVATGATAAYRVPTIADDALGVTWAAVDFDDSGWATGPTGLGFATSGTSSFGVTYFKANTTVSDLTTAEAVIADPALQSAVVTESPQVINYTNTGGSAHFSGDAPFPGTQIGVDVNDFVVQVTGAITIPTAGAWTFGVNSDDGFSLELGRQPQVFTSSFPGTRGAGDTLATFNITEPGTYTLRLVYFERGGGSELEFFAAPGSLSSFSSAFHLVGDTASGGLAVSSVGALIGTDVGAVMQNINGSLWSRVQFDLADPAAVDLLSMRMAYEDGFVAYLNGIEVARRNAPAAVSWDSVALADRPANEINDFEKIDLTDQASVLLTGNNVLAVQGLNDSVADGTFLLLPELITVASTLAGTPAYFTPATPGAYNALGYPGVSGSPTFSHANGLFTAPFSLTVTAAAPGAVIRYTLDGSDPTETHGTVYSGAISVTDSTRIRARVFEPGLAPGPVLTRFYAKLAADVLGFSSDLPIVVVDTFGDGVNQTWLAETLTSVIPTSGARAAITDAPAFTGPAGLRIRGSSSAGFPKKQYFLEVWNEYRQDLDASLLGMPQESDWILYGPYTDKTLMRNVLAYKWSNDIGRYAIRTCFVEAFLRTAAGPVASSDYVGVYVLEEKIKQDPNRVNLVDLQPEDSEPPEVTGGYIIKKDRLDPGDTGFFTSIGQRLSYVEPKEEEITTAQAAYLSGYLNQMETVLYGPGFQDPITGYASYIDVDSFIDHHILVELTKNIDGFRLSTFMFKDRLGKLNMGPIWDYNLSLGNANYNDGWLTTGWYNDILGNGDYPWWRRLFEDPEFGVRYADRWYAFRRDAFRTDKLLADIDALAAQLEEAQARNYARWPILGTYVWPNWYIGNTYQEEIAWMKQWLSDRLVWIDGQFSPPPSFNHAGGQVPWGFDLTITATAGVVYYTLDGNDPRSPGGATSPSAILYSGPLDIDQVRFVRTRALDGATWSAINEDTFAPIPPAYVNEVLPQNVTVLADDHGDFDPWIELYNPTTATVDLSGLFLTDDPAFPQKWPIPPNTILCGKQRLLVWADAEPAEGPFHANFRPAVAGGTIRLYDTGGALADALTYPTLASNVSYGRNPDGSSTLTQFLYPTPGEANRSNTTPILLNEYNGVAPTKFLASAGSDTFWGTVLGNGGDWFELVVVKDHLDLRGWQVIVNDNSGAISTTLTFTSAAILGDLRSGTIVTISADLPSDVSYDPPAGDWWINLQAGPSGDGLYVSNLAFSVSQQNTQITILNAASAVVFGPAGEGINPVSGIGNDEVFKLQQDPGPTVTAFSDYQDGTSSSFGSPNLWSGGTFVQDFSALRGVVSGVCTTEGDCNDANPCTDDACVLGHCQDTPNTAMCDDGDACTDGDVCADRVCAGQPNAGCCVSDCDCDDGDGCTNDACVNDTCVHLASGSCGVSGTVAYYRDATGGSGTGVEPSAKPVPAVDIDLNGDGTADVTTDAAGAFDSGGLAGPVTVTTLTKFGSLRAADDNGAITSFDASTIGRASVGLFTLSPNQRVAADVTGDGTISAFDASYVGRFAAQLVDHFDVAVTTGSDWRFLRCDAYTYPGEPGCGPPSYDYTPIAQLQPGTNFHAILYGDVTGNWQPSGAAARASANTSVDERNAAVADRRLAQTLSLHTRSIPTKDASDPPAELAVVRWDKPLRKGGRREVTIDLHNADGILGLDLELKYDPARIAVVGVRASGIASEFMLTQAATGGRHRIALYGVLPLTGSGAVVTVTVEALSGAIARAPLTVTGVANEGRVPIRVAEHR